MTALLSQFAELNQRLAETGSKLEKRALMAEYAPYGITFNTVAPGLISTTSSGRADFAAVGWASKKASAARRSA